MRASILYEIIKLRETEREREREREITVFIIVLRQAL